MNALTYQEAKTMPVAQMRRIHALEQRGWKFMYLGAISHDAYLEGIGRRCIAVMRDGSVERVA